MIEEDNNYCFEVCCVATVVFALLFGSMSVMVVDTSDVNTAIKEGCAGYYNSHNISNFNETLCSDHWEHCWKMDRYMLKVIKEMIADMDHLGLQISYVDKSINASDDRRIKIIDTRSSVIYELHANKNCHEEKYTFRLLYNNQ